MLWAGRSSQSTSVIGESEAGSGAHYSGDSALFLWGSLLATSSLLRFTTHTKPAIKVGELYFLTFYPPPIKFGVPQGRAFGPILFLGLLLITITEVHKILERLPT